MYTCKLNADLHDDLLHTRVCVTDPNYNTFNVANNVNTASHNVPVFVIELTATFLRHNVWAVGPYELSTDILRETFSITSYSTET
jgi:hypothetical protein